MGTWLLVSLFLLFPHTVKPVSDPLWIRQNPRFCYDPNRPCGPPNWPGTCQTGQNQSPIDISGFIIKAFERIGIFKFNSPYISKQNSFFARNTGHSFQVQFLDGLQPSSSLQFGDVTLKNGFTFGQLHFHWGAEHTLDGVRYPLEMHIVHYNKRYANLADAFAAATDPEAVAVFSVLFKLGKANKALQSIIDVASLPENTEEKDDFMDYMRNINVNELLPKKSHFARYSGSLTTPPCTEQVEWSVFLHPVSISLEQLMTFQRLLDFENMLFMNYRPTQPLNGRKVKFYKAPAIRRSLGSIIAAGKYETVLSLLSPMIGLVRNNMVNFWGAVQEFFGAFIRFS